MNSIAASKMLDNLYTLMNPSTRIAVIGGGPSGLSAALALTRLGYKNITVLEQNAKVGGMCRSEIIEGHVYDLGGQVIARESSPTLDTLMAEMGMELELLGEQPFSLIDFASGQLQDLKIVSDVLSMLKVTEKLQEAGEASGKLGVRAVSSVAHETSQTYLRSSSKSEMNPKGLVEVPRAVAGLFTASGYGYPEHMPYAYMHDFVMSCLGQPWRVKGGYDSFWQKIAATLADVRCNTRVQSIQRQNNKIHISVVHCESTCSSPASVLEFDKLIMSGSSSIPINSKIYLSAAPKASLPAEEAAGILDYSAKELEVFSKVEIVDYYTTVLKISGFENFPPRFYYPDYASDPSTVGRFVTMQKFHADTNVFLFWSYGSAEVDQNRVTELLFEDVQKMGGHVEALVLQRKFRYFPHVSSRDMRLGFYDKLEGLQGENNTYYVGALMAFELTERNSSYSINLMAKRFGSAEEPIYVKRLVEYPLPNGAQEPDNYHLREQAELPGFEFPDLPSVDAYLAFYAHHPLTRDKILYTWLDDQGKETKKLTFSELDARATTIARHLLTCRLNLKPGDRVVLLHPPGLEFIEAFLGCLRAKIIAVPLIPPDPSKKGGDLALEKLKYVVKVTDAKAILTTRTYHSVVRASSLSIMGNGPAWPNLPWIKTNCLSTDDSVVSGWFPRGLKKTASASSILGEIDGVKGPLELGLSTPPDSDSVCFLQFTSGSTGDAKGVMITHGSLIHNTKSMRTAYRGTTQSVTISWLPQYHDMGLIGSLLVSLVCGGHAVKFSPLTFIRKPLMWLSLVDKYRATHTAAPNFGFDLVLKRYEALKLLGKEPKLDLSSLRFLMVGAEPINSQTMKGFVETFWDAGLREQSFAPGFGLAENCVFICCAYGRNQPIKVDSEGRVSCGYIESGEPRYKDICADVRIVDPVTFNEVGEGVEGEIWLSSRSNGKGYWGLEALTKEMFYAHLQNAASEDSTKRFVRSGDLGRKIEGNLFVTGRIKDLIIVGGRNYYPSDIEKTVESCSNMLKPGCSAAFSISANILRSKGVSLADDSDGIVVVAEVRDERQVDPTITSKIKSAVAEVHGLQVSFVSLIRPHTIPKTTSGKIRRRECAKRFAEGTLSSVRIANLSIAQARLRRSAPKVAGLKAQGTHQRQLSISNPTKGKKEISDFLVSLVAEVSGTPLSRISLTESFESYSIDSHGAVSAASKLSEFIGTHISAIQIYTTGCISELADLSVEVMEKSKAASAGRSNVQQSAEIPSIREEESAVQQQIDRSRLENIDEELSEAELAEALEPTSKRKLFITSLQMLGVLYMGLMLFSPALYIYKKLIWATTVGEYNSFGHVFQSSALVPLGWMIYTTSVGLMLSMFGARMLLPMNHQSVTMTIPLWSVEYVRWWTLYRLQDFASSSIAAQLRGTGMLGFWYRLLGADIEDGVYLDTTDITDPWLVSIGRDSCIGEGATIQCHEVNAGVVRFQSVSVGKACAVGPYSILQRGSTLEAGSSVGALCKTEVGEHVRSTGTTQMSSKGSKFPSNWSLEIAAKQLLGLYLVGLVSTLAALAAYIVLTESGSYLGVLSDSTCKAIGREASNHGYLLLSLTLTFPKYLMIVAPLLIFPEHPALLLELLKDVATQGKVLAALTAFGAGYLAYGVTLAALTCILKWSVIGRMKEGTSSHYSYRRWFIHALLRTTHERFMSLLQGTEALCIYLRMLGADIGQRVSIRKINALIDPDLIKLGDDCHLGDFCKIITTETIQGGVMSSASISIGGRCVVGAQSVVMPGSTLQDRAVLGAMSVAPRGATLETDGVYVGAPIPVRVNGTQPSQKTEKAKRAKIEAQIGTPESFVAFNENPLAFNMDPRFRQIVGTCAGEFARKTPKGHHRYIHHLGASGKGTLRVLQNAPNLPPHDIFTPGSTYPVLIRYSTGNSKDDDRRAEVRGATMRLLHTDSPDDLENPLLDLLMKTGTYFHAQNMVDFMGYYIMTDEERVQKIKEFPPLGESQWLNLRRPNSWADLHYYGCTCRYFVTKPTEGPPEVFYVRFKIRPADPSIGDDIGNVQRQEEFPPFDGMLPVLPDDTRRKTCLRDELKARLESPEGVKYMLQMQLHPIPTSVEEKEKVQDPTRFWDETSCPNIDVAEIWLTEHIDDTVFDKTNFNPRFAPPSLAMITATSATQSASIDTARAILHDLLTYIKSGIPLPPIWNDLIKKSHSDVLTTRPNDSLDVANGCPFSGGGVVSQGHDGNKDNQEHMQNGESDVKMNGGHVDNVAEKSTTVAGERKNSVHLSLGLNLMRLVQPIVQVEVPMLLSLLAACPILVTLSWVGSVAGNDWMLGLLPLGFLCWGLMFAVLSIVCKWVTARRVRDGSTNELWSRQTFLLTVWECINQTMGRSFLELGKGSVLITLYLRFIGASVKTTGIYIDTLYALNPDQLKVGYRSAIGRNALLFGHLYEGEKVGFKSCVIEDDTFIGSRALVLPGFRMEDGAELQALGLGMKDEVVKAAYT
ncbi:hypothetical protein Mapa_003253 [Marchantia paleacea]|nr:hypothetical protein Mapa_003253 [Marchantia paleacea]